MRAQVRAPRRPEITRNFRRPHSIYAQRVGGGRAIFLPRDVVYTLRLFVRHLQVRVSVRAMRLEVDFYIGVIYITEILFAYFFTFLMHYLKHN